MQTREGRTTSSFFNTAHWRRRWEIKISALSFLFIQLLTSHWKENNRKISKGYSSLRRHLHEDFICVSYLKSACPLMLRNNVTPLCPRIEPAKATATVRHCGLSTMKYCLVSNPKERGSAPILSARPWFMVRTQFSAGFFWGEIGRLSLEVLGFCDCMCNDVFSSLRIQFIRKICSIQMS